MILIMNNLLRNIILLIVLMVISTTLAISQDLERIYQQGLQKEIGEGDLTEAINIYNAILLDDNASRQMKAKVLLHIGGCYQKLGNNEASEVYQLIISDYGEQKEFVDIAKSRLNRIVDDFNEPDFPTGVKLQQIWVGLNTSGSVSPDGKYISYWDNESGNLGYKNILTGESVLLTDEATYEAPMQFTINSTISPNGNEIAYSWYNPDSTYEVRIVEIDKPVPGKVFGEKNEEAFPISWSPDGQWLLIMRFIDSADDQLISLNIATRDIKVLNEVDDGYWMRSWYSPDSKNIAFDIPIEENNGNFDIYLVNHDDGRKYKTIEHPANDRLMGWSADGNRIIFISDRTGTWDLWSQNIEDQLAVGPAERVFPGIGFVSSLGKTNSNAMFYGIFSRRHTTNMFPLGENYTPDCRVSKPLLGSKYYAETSYDSNYMAFIEEMIKPAGPGHYSRPLQVKNRLNDKTQIILDNYDSRAPRWANNSLKLVFPAYKQNTDPTTDYYGGIYIYDLMADEIIDMIMLPERKPEYGLSWIGCIADWSADDSKIIFLDGSGLRLYNLANKKDSTLISNYNLSSILDVSPEGDMVLFAIRSSKNQAGKLMTYSLNTGNIREILESPNQGDFQSAIWSPEVSKVYFTENTKKGMGLWQLDMYDNSIELLWESELKNFSLGLDKSGLKIAISSFMQEFEIWRMQNALSPGQSNR